jgi:hypothetical protein
VRRRPLRREVGWMTYSRRYPPGKLGGEGASHAARILARATFAMRYSERAALAAARRRSAAGRPLGGAYLIRR